MSDLASGSDGVKPLTEPGQRPSRRRSALGFWLRLFLVGLVLPVTLIGLYLWAALSYAYSEGERAGYVRTFARRGWICKTWEGELNVAVIPGSTPETFAFTVKDGATAQAINQTLGTPVRLHYRQHVGVPGSCFGETQYYVDGVAPAEGIRPPAGPAPASSPTPGPESPSPAAPSPSSQTTPLAGR